MVSSYFNSGLLESEGYMKLDASIYDLFEYFAEKYKTNNAILDEENNVTYQDLKFNVDYIAGYFHRLGLKKGDRIALMLPNSIEFIYSFFAAHKIGAIVVPVNPMYQSYELTHIFNNAGISFLVSLQESGNKIDNLNLENKVIKIIIDEYDSPFYFRNVQSKWYGDVPKAEINPKEDVAIIQYTGGTTGLPKGVMLTHYNIVLNLHQIYFCAEEIYSLPNHRLLGGLPLIHAMGLINMAFILCVGGMYIPIKRFIIDDVIEKVRKYRPTLFQGSPTMYIALLNNHQITNEDLSSFKLLISGSGPAPIELIKNFQKKTSAYFIEGYGLSEATNAVIRNPIHGEKKIGSIGIPILGTSVKIVNQENGVDEIDINEIGEIIIKGPQVMKGYWENEEETNKAIRNGWLYTGDLAKIDTDGYIYIVGRKKDMIIAGGYNIYPDEIEQVIYLNKAVKECCVIGIPDPYRGETVKAYIVFKDGMYISEEEIQKWCRIHLAKYKVPKIIEFRESLPRTSVGKLLRRALREELISNQGIDSKYNL